MPRYFFHIRDGREYIDLQGTVLANLQEARIEAVRFAAQLLRDRPAEFWNEMEWHMRVATEDDLSLFQLTFFATDSPAVGSGSIRASPAADSSVEDPVAELNIIKEHAEILGSDGKHVGVVDRAEGDRIQLVKREGEDHHRYLAKADRKSVV